MSELHVSPEPIGFADSGNRTSSIIIYGHSDNHMQTNTSAKKYYYSPVCQLDFVGDSSDLNGKLRLTIQVWNKDVEDQVLDYLSGREGYEVQPEQIRFLPFDKVCVDLSNHFRLNSIEFSGVGHWIDYESTRSQFINLVPFCSSQANCSWVESKIRSFSELGKVHFSTGLQIAKTKEVSFRIGELINEDLLDKIRHPLLPEDVTEGLFRAQFVYHLLDEHVQNILMASFGYCHSCNSTVESRFGIVEKVKQILLIDEFVLGGKENEAELWNSLYWPDKNRPDKVADVYNFVYYNLFNDKQREVFLNSYEGVKINRVREAYETGNVSALFTIKDCGDNNSTHNSSCSAGKETLSLILDCPLLYNCHVSEVVEFSYRFKKFVPMPQVCYKMSLQNLPENDTRAFNFTINYSTALFSVPLY